MNKSFKLYGSIFIILIVFFAILQISKSESTDWRKNFQVTEKKPFGLFIFNAEANELMHDKVRRVDISPYDYLKNHSNAHQNFLLIQPELDIESWNEILKKINIGSDILVLSENLHPEIADSLGLQLSTISLRTENILRLTDVKFASDSLVLDKLPGGKGFLYLSDFHEILGKADLDGEKVNFIKINYGKGHIYLHSEPLFLTNYYLLKTGYENYAQNVFSYLPDRETVWFIRSNKSVSESQSPLRFILSKPALKYAWWLLLSGLLLFVIFNIKRKQRIVPIIEPLKNKSVDFVKSIGNLYMQEGDFHDMMAKKAQYFLNRVRTELLIETYNLDENFAHILHLKTGRSLEKIHEALDYIKRGQNPYANVQKDELEKMNRLLDEILQ